VIALEVNHFLALFLTLLTCFSGCGAPGRVSRASPVVVDTYARIVQVIALCTDGSQRGSGVRIGGTNVLTAKHVIDCGDGELVMLTVKDRAHKTYVAVLEGDSPSDVARLNVLFMPPMKQVQVAAPVLGETLCALFALPELGRRCGEVWPGTKSVTADVVIDFVAEKGNSGSGVFDSRGRLVGILVVLRFCQGTVVPQVCTAGATSLATRSWLAAP
jgi:hypothetical protein